MYGYVFVYSFHGCDRQLATAQERLLLSEIHVLGSILCCGMILAWNKLKSRLMASWLPFKTLCIGNRLMKRAASYHLATHACNWKLKSEAALPTSTEKNLSVCFFELLLFPRLISWPPNMLLVHLPRYCSRQSRLVCKAPFIVSVTVSVNLTIATLVFPGKDPLRQFPVLVANWG